MSEHADNCGCPKPPGSYGTGGWHFALVDAAYIAEKIRNAEALDRATEGGGYTRGGIFRTHREDAEFWRNNGAHYLGQSIAWERCPAYMAAARKNGGA